MTKNLHRRLLLAVVHRPARSLCVTDIAVVYVPMELAEGVEMDKSPILFINIT